jgi:hypothetical protein
MAQDKTGSMKPSLLELAEQFAAKAKSARKTECARDYQNYWRGYAEACDEIAAALRASNKEQEQ